MICFLPLACVVLRNVGTVPLEVKSLTFNEDFTKQLQTKTQERLKKKESTSIVIFPGQKWIISFDTNVFDIINGFEEKRSRLIIGILSMARKNLMMIRLKLIFLSMQDF